MDSVEYIGLSSKIFLNCTFKEDGTWEVCQTFISSRSKDGVDWEDKEVSVKAFAKDLATAITNAQISINTYLSKHNYDLFSIEGEGVS